MAQVKSSLPAIYGDHPGSGELNPATYVLDRRSVIRGHDALVDVDIMNAVPPHRPSGWSRRVAAL
jgi:hypothetical protein